MSNKQKDFVGCPKCNNLKHYTRFPKTDHDGMPLYRRGRPLTECRYAEKIDENDTSLYWQRKLYICSECNHIYDRREATTKKHGGFL